MMGAMLDNEMGAKLGVGLIAMLCEDLGARLVISETTLQSSSKGFLLVYLKFEFCKKVFCKLKESIALKSTNIHLVSRLTLALQLCLELLLKKSNLKLDQTAKSDYFLLDVQTGHRQNISDI